jgi:cyclic-di-GMP phosphodiesterase TipF (flagellum assembly factor)
VIKALPHLFAVVLYGVLAVVVALAFPDRVVVTQATVGWIVGALLFVSAVLLHEIWARRRNQRATAERIAAIAAVVKRLRDEGIAKPATSVAEAPLPDEGAPARPNEMELLQRLSQQMRTPPEIAAKVPKPKPAPIAPAPIAPAIEPSVPDPGMMDSGAAERTSQAFAAAGRMAEPSLGPIEPVEQPQPKRVAAQRPPRDDRYFDPDPPEDDTPIGPEDVDDEAYLIESVREALDNDRIELYVRDVVALPSRKLEFQDCIGQVRTHDGKVIAPDVYGPVVEQYGYATGVANMLLLRIVQHIRRGRRRGQPVPFICSIGKSTLSDRTFFVDFVSFMRDNADLAPHVVFALAQYDLYRLDPRADEELANLAKLGFRFCLDEVQNLDLFVNDLSQKGFRFVKVKSSLLTTTLDRSGDPRALKRALDRGAMDLIVEDLSSESQVLDLLDYAVDFGAGPVFGPARPL